MSVNKPASDKYIFKPEDFQKKIDEDNKALAGKIDENNKMLLSFFKPGAGDTGTQIPQSAIDATSTAAEAGAETTATSSAPGVGGATAAGAGMAMGLMENLQKIFPSENAKKTSSGG